VSGGKQYPWTEDENVAHPVYWDSFGRGIQLVSEQGYRRNFFEHLPENHPARVRHEAELAEMRRADAEAR
jgi:hypothetical protein